MEDKKESRVDQETKKNQDRFIGIYRQGASVKSAAEGTGISRRTVQLWVKADKFGFTERFDGAQSDFKDSLIEMAMGRLNEQKPSDSPLLLITMLNAYIPEKFRPTSASTEEVAKDTIKELRTLAKNAFVAKPAEEEELSERSPMQQVEEIILKKKGD